MDILTYLKTAGCTQADFARRLMVTPAYINQIIGGVRRVPAERCSEIERATGGLVTCEELRPDLAEHWAYLRGNAAAPAKDAA